jgi:chromosome segregation ATPase
MTQTQTQNNAPDAVSEARDRISNIQAAIVSGNKKLTPRDLSDAKSALEFAELQAQARETVKREAAEAERKLNLLNLQKRLAVVRDSHKVIDAKLETFTKSLNEYLTACSTFQTNLNNVRTALREDGLYPESDVIIAGVPAGKLAFGVQIQDRLRTLSIGEISATNVNPAESIKQRVEQSVAEFERNF